MRRTFIGVAWVSPVGCQPSVLGLFALPSFIFGDHRYLHFLRVIFCGSTDHDPGSYCYGSLEILRNLLAGGSR